MEELERKEELASDLTDLVSKIRATADPQVLYAELLGFRARGGSRLPDLVGDIGDEASEETQLLNPTPPPELEIMEWWGSQFGRPLSRNRYDKFRHAWAEYSKSTQGPSAVVNAAEILKHEFELVSQTAMAQPVSCVPEQAAAEVLRKLHSYLGVLANDTCWDNCTASYRKSLAEYFSNLTRHAPSWLVEIGSRSSPVLTWGDCVPLAEQRQVTGLRHCLEHLPHLSKLTLEIARA